jgi:proteic killer suppression protein
LTNIGRGPSTRGFRPILRRAVSTKPSNALWATKETVKFSRFRMLRKASRPGAIRSFVHKGLKRLYEDNSAKGVPPDTVDKLRKMFAFLDAMQEADELRAVTVWKVHTLLGDRKGTRSLSVTRNRRLTF